MEFMTIPYLTEVLFSFGVFLLVYGFFSSLNMYIIVIMRLYHDTDTTWNSRKSILFIAIGILLIYYFH